MNVITVCWPFHSMLDSVFSTPGVEDSVQVQDRDGAKGSGLGLRLSDFPTLFRLSYFVIVIVLP